MPVLLNYEICQNLQSGNTVDWVEVAHKSKTKEEYFMQVIKFYIAKPLCYIPESFAEFAMLWYELFHQKENLLNIVDHLYQRRVPDIEIVYGAIEKFTIRYIQIDHQSQHAKTEIEKTQAEEELKKAQKELMSYAKYCVFSTYKCKEYGYETAFRYCNNVTNDDYGVEIYRDIMNATCGATDTADIAPVQRIEKKFAYLCNRDSGEGKQFEPTLKAILAMKITITHAQNTNMWRNVYLHDLRNEFDDQTLLKAINYILKYTGNVICNPIKYKNIGNQTVCNYIQFHLQTIANNCSK